MPHFFLPKANRLLLCLQEVMRGGILLVILLSLGVHQDLLPHIRRIGDSLMRKDPTLLQLNRNTVLWRSSRMLMISSSKKTADLCKVISWDSKLCKLEPPS